MMQRQTIRELRTAAGMSQRQLAQRIGASSMAVSHWESYRNEPGARQLRALAAVFGVSMDAIAFEREAQHEGGWNMATAQRRVFYKALDDARLLRVWFHD